MKRRPHNHRNAQLDLFDEIIVDNFAGGGGAPMTDDGVDIVMERLEALKDGM